MTYRNKRWYLNRISNYIKYVFAGFLTRLSRNVVKAGYVMYNLRDQRPLIKCQVYPVGEWTQNMDTDTEDRGCMKQLPGSGGCLHCETVPATAAPRS